MKINENDLYKKVDKKITVILKNGKIVTGILDDISSPEDNENNMVSIDVLKSDYTIEWLFEDEIKSII